MMTINEPKSNQITLLQCFGKVGNISVIIEAKWLIIKVEHQLLDI